MEKENTKTMADVPLFDEDYRKAFLILNHELARIKGCSEKGEVWEPEIPEIFEEALATYTRWHPEPGENFILNFPWPNPGRVPMIPTGIFRPSPGDREKIERFIEKHEGVEADEVTQGIVELAKIILEEIH